MMETYQKTISRKIKFSGVGLHSGQNSTVNLIPANEDQGIVFKRIDVNENNIIEAKFSNVTSARLCTTLENKFGIKVSTVEHLLAAIYIAGVDNVTIEINNEEVPIMDGSAKEFLNVLKKENLIEQSKKRKYLKISNKIKFSDGNKKISIEPSQAALEVDFQLNYKNKLIGKQKNVVNFQKDNLEDVSNSRTFCLYEDIERIKKSGLAKGGSLQNAVVVDNDKVLNEGGLRNEKEFVNHKILDLAGDFLLSGYRILGKVKCQEGGHELTNKFLREIFSTSSNFELITSDKNLKPFKTKEINLSNLAATA